MHRTNRHLANLTVRLAIGLALAAGCSSPVELADDAGVEDSVDAGESIDAALECQPHLFEVDGECVSCAGFDNPDSICGTGICDRRGGVCIPESDVVFVAPDGNAENDCLTKLAPCDRLRDGLAAAINGQRSVVHLSSGTHRAIATTGRAIRVIGYGATIVPRGGNIVITVASGTADFEGVSFDGEGIGNRAFSVIAGASLRLLDVSITNHGTGAISRGSLDVESSRFADAISGVIAVGGQLSIKNSLFRRMSRVAIDVDGAAQVALTLNTVATAQVPGLRCDEAARGTVTGNLLLRTDDTNGGTEPAVQGCDAVDFSRSFANDAALSADNLTDKPTLDTELAPVAGSSAIDDPGLEVSALYEDGDTDALGRPRLVGGGLDIGGLEAQ